MPRKSVSARSVYVTGCLASMRPRHECRGRVSARKRLKRHANHRAPRALPMEVATVAHPPALAVLHDVKQPVVRQPVLVLASAAALSAATTAFAPAPAGTAPP